jgi:hypothetical protein
MIGQVSVGRANLLRHKWLILLPYHTVPFNFLPHLVPIFRVLIGFFHGACWGADGLPHIPFRNICWCGLTGRVPSGMASTSRAEGEADCKRWSNAVPSGLLREGGQWIGPVALVLLHIMAHSLNLKWNSSIFSSIFGLKDVSLSC